MALRSAAFRVTDCSGKPTANPGLEPGERGFAAESRTRLLPSVALRSEGMAGARQAYQSKKRSIASNSSN